MRSFLEIESVCVRVCAPLRRDSKFHANANAREPLTKLYIFYRGMIEESLQKAGLDPFKFETR